MIEQIRLIKTKTNNATDEQTFAVFQNVNIHFLLTNLFVYSTWNASSFENLIIINDNDTNQKHMIKK